jgi:hypothetical protein
MPDHPRCACGKPLWRDQHNALAKGKCVTCAELAIRQATIRKLVKSGAMAAMRRALEACPDAEREAALQAGQVSESHELALGMLVGMANAEVDHGTDGECQVQPLRSGGKRLSDSPMGSQVPLWRAYGVGLHSPTARSNNKSVVFKVRDNVRMAARRRDRGRA